MHPIHNVQQESVFHRDAQPGTTRASVSSGNSKKKEHNGENMSMQLGCFYAFLVFECAGGT